MGRSITAHLVVCRWEVCNGDDWPIGAIGTDGFGEYEAVDGFGGPLGVFPTRAEAKAAIVEAESVAMAAPEANRTRHGAPRLVEA